MESPVPTLAELTDSYVNGAAQLRAAVAGMSTEQIEARPIAGKWSTLEVVAHLADFEPIIAERMKRTIALTKPLILGADENEFAKFLAYDKRILSEELDLIDAVRRQMARVLRNIPDATLQKTCVHSERGLLNLQQLLTTAIGHVTHHLAFIVEKKKSLGIA